MNEVGKIGTMYENRKTKQVGVLESREEKYKTLLMRDESGKSFSITYSTFKSNWRQYQGDKVIQTSSQKTEEDENVEKEAEKSMENLKEGKDASRKQRYGRILYSKEDQIKIVEETYNVLQNIFKDQPSLIVSTYQKNFVAVKYKSKRLFEVWPDLRRSPVDKFRVVTKEEIWDEMVFSKDLDAQVFPNWNLTHRFEVDLDDLEKCIESLRKAVLDLYVIPALEKERKKKEAEKAKKEEDKKAKEEKEEQK